MPRDKETQAKRMREWRKKNPDKVHSTEAKRAQSIRRKRWIENNKEREKERLRKLRNTPEYRAKGRIYERKWNQTPKGRFRAYKDASRAKGLSLDITLEQFMEFWQKPCSYCGGEIKTIGLDRVDNSLGYTKENIISCCIICNNMKKNLPSEVFIVLCRKIIDFN